jgi:hypothetical protein
MLKMRQSINDDTLNIYSWSSINLTWSVLLFPSFAPYVKLSHHTALHHDFYDAQSMGCRSKGARNTHKLTQNYLCKKRYKYLLHLY